MITRIKKTAISDFTRLFPEQSPAKYYVLCNDRFMSGWGTSENKINTLILLCDSEIEALNLIKNIEHRGDQTHIRMKSTMNDVRLNPITHYYQVKTKADMPRWYK